MINFMDGADITGHAYGEKRTTKAGLTQRLSTRGDFAASRHWQFLVMFLVLTTGGCCWLVGRGQGWLLHILLHTGQSPQQRIIWPQISIMPWKSEKSYSKITQNAKYLSNICSYKYIKYISDICSRFQNEYFRIKQNIWRKTRRIFIYFEDGKKTSL